MWKAIDFCKVKSYFRHFVSSPTIGELLVLYFTSGCMTIIASDVLIPFEWGALFCTLLYLVIFIYILRVTLLLFIFCSDIKAIKKTNWILFSINAVILIMILGTNIDLKLRLWFSRDLLMKEVNIIDYGIKKNGIPETIRSLKEKNIIDKNSGLFNIQFANISEDGKTIWFHTVWGSDCLGFIPDCVGGGIVYSEREPSHQGNAEIYEHLWGNWWRWVQRM
jgi:hypothetical protein